MVTGPAGYEATVEVHLDTMTATSSLNDIRLVTSESCRVSAFAPQPSSHTDLLVRFAANCPRLYNGMGNALGLFRFSSANRFFTCFGTI